MIQRRFRSEDAVRKIIDMPENNEDHDSNNNDNNHEDFILTKGFSVKQPAIRSISSYHFLNFFVYEIFCTFLYSKIIHRDVV